MLTISISQTALKWLGVPLFGLFVLGLIMCVRTVFDLGLDAAVDLVAGRTDRRSRQIWWVLTLIPFIAWCIWIVLFL